jgi:hypothetical protein
VINELELPNLISKTEHEERSANDLDWIYGMVQRELMEKGFLMLRYDILHSTL